MTDRLADTKKLTAAFRNFANAPNKRARTLPSTFIPHESFTIILTVDDTQGWKRVGRLETPNPFVFSDTSRKAKGDSFAEVDLHVLGLKLRSERIMVITSVKAVSNVQFVLTL